MIRYLKNIILNRIFAKLHSSTWSHYYQDTKSTAELTKRYPEIGFSGATPLCEIMTQTGSDKGNGWHNYTKVYASLFAGMKVNHLFELGIGTTDTSFGNNMGAEGTPMASHRGWKGYFKNATIHAADIDEHMVKNEEGIYAYHCDQTDAASIQTMWAHPIIPEAFDIMIDDGLHVLEAYTHFFENSIHKLRAGGIYIVEDLLSVKLGYWEQKIKEEYTQKYPDLVFRLCSIPNRANALDNNLLIIYKTA